MSRRRSEISEATYLILTALLDGPPHDPGRAALREEAGRPAWTERRYRALLLANPACS